MRQLQNQGEAQNRRELPEVKKNSSTPQRANNQPNVVTSLRDVTSAQTAKTTPRKRHFVSGANTAKIPTKSLSTPERSDDHFFLLNFRNKYLHISSLFINFALDNGNIVPLKSFHKIYVFIDCRLLEGFVVRYSPFLIVILAETIFIP